MHDSLAPIAIDPDEVLPCGVDFSAELDAITTVIENVDVTAEAGLDVLDGSVAHENGVVRAIISPSVAEGVFALTFTVSAAGGYTIIRRLPVHVHAAG